ncbi:MAG: alpha/beta fold hydrolase [Chloroflexota bacterium]
MKKFLRIPLILLIIYLATAAILIITNRSTEMAVEGMHFDFGVWATVADDTLPDLQPYTSRDGSTLHYRFYKSETETENVLILLHASGWHSMQFHQLANALSQNDVAHVYTPDLRGHGFTPEKRGDVDYIGQMEDDIADLIGVVKTRFPQSDIVIGGHSSGGGLAVRFAGSEYGKLADSYLLLAPYLQYNAPTTRPNSGGWARPLTPRIIGLLMLNSVGIRWFNEMTVIQFAMPQEMLTGALGDTATTAYSYRLNTSFAPRADYGSDLAAMQQPFLLVAGLEDESFIAEQYEPTINQYATNGEYILLPDIGHIDLLTPSSVATVVIDWLQAIDADTETALGN